jgi:Flp pilus assembly protein protease CpaA
MASYAGFNGIVLSAAILTCIAGAYTDWRWRIIPNWICYPSLLFALCCAWLAGGAPWLRSAAAGAGIFAAPLLFAFFLRSAGGGDVKFAAALGAFFGFPLVVDVFGLSLVLSLVYIVAVACSRLGLGLMLSALARGGVTVSRLLRFGLVDHAAHEIRERAPRLTVPYGTAAGGAGLAVIAMRGGAVFGG